MRYPVDMQLRGSSIQALKGLIESSPPVGAVRISPSPARGYPVIAYWLLGRLARVKVLCGLKWFVT